MTAEAEADLLLTLLQSKSDARLVAGVYRGLLGMRATVDFEGGRVPAHFATAWRPAVNDNIWVLIVGGVAWLLGPTGPLASDATVVSVASGFATCSSDVGTIIATYEFGTTPTAGQQVKVIHNGGYHIIAVKSTSPAPTPPGGGVSTPVGEFTQTFLAVDAGSFQSYWWNSQVWAQSSGQGAWFYGTKIPGTIPAAATILSVEVYCSVVSLFGGDPVWVVHGLPTRPAGSPALSGGTAIHVSGSGWLALPTSFGNQLKAGGGGYGLGLNHGGLNKFNSLAADPQSGAIRIRYRV
jgi:hypothetical protein